MKKNETVKLGFLQFKQENDQLKLHRTGLYLSAEYQICQPGNQGLFHIRTNERCYEGDDLKFIRFEQQENELKLIFETVDQTLIATANFQLDPESGIIIRKDSLKNQSGRELHILRFYSRMSFQSNDYEVYAQQSRWGLEAQGQWCRLHTGAMELISRHGRWTECGSPFAAIRSDETANTLAFHLLPNGDYVMRFALPGFSTNKCPLVLETGLNDERLDYVLSADGIMGGTSLLIQELPGREVYSGTAALHRYANKNLIKNERHLPIVYNTWLDVMTRLDVPRLRRQLAAAKKAGCEVFVIDAGWYDMLGSWQEHQDKAFYGKMKEFGDEVRAAGLKFGIWMEPETFQADAPVVKEHPEWFEPTEPAGGTFRKKFCCQEAIDHHYNMFATLIRQYNLDYMKLDMNASLGVDATGRALSHYVAAHHEIMTRLRNDFPNTVFENCSSGAMRTTLGELPYFDQHFISDNGNVLDVLHITQGMLLRFPPGRILRWLVIASGGMNELWGENKQETVLQVQNATWKHYEETDLNCGLLASMTGVMGFSGDLASFTDETLAKIKRYTAYYAANRDSFQRSEATLLTPPQSIDHRHGTIGFQFTDPVQDKHFVFTFYRDCDGMTGTVFPLQGLCPEKQYLVKKVTFDAAEEECQQYSGAELSKDGLEFVFELEQHGDFKAILMEISAK